MPDHNSIISPHRDVRDEPPCTGTALPDNKRVPEGLAEPCRLKPPTSYYLSRSYRETDDMFFQNMTDAMAIMKRAQWYSPANDASIPQTDEDHRKVVKKLTQAFKDMGSAKDTTNNSYRKRFMPDEKGYYRDWAIENCAWTIIVRKALSELALVSATNMS